jgi:hypothetical protein
MVVADNHATITRRFWWCEGSINIDSNHPGSSGNHRSVILDFGGVGLWILSHSSTLATTCLTIDLGSSIFLDSQASFWANHEFYTSIITKETILALDLPIQSNSHPLGLAWQGSRSHGLSNDIPVSSMSRFQAIAKSEQFQKQWIKLSSLSHTRQEILSLTLRCLSSVATLLVRTHYPH